MSMSADRLTYSEIPNQFGDNICQPGFTGTTLGNSFERSLDQRYLLNLPELNNITTQPSPKTSSMVGDQQN
jgi:hypothetical protein